jgi:hypothetical protein
MAGKLDIESHVYLLGPLGPLLLVELMPFLKTNLADID